MTKFPQFWEEDISTWKDDDFVNDEEIGVAQETGILSFNYIISSSLMPE